MDEKTIQLALEVQKRYERAQTEGLGSFDIGLTKNWKKRMIYVEIGDEDYPLPYHSLADAPGIGDDLAEKIFNWITP